jgi:hypothetical protein
VSLEKYEKLEYNAKSLFKTLLLDDQFKKMLEYALKFPMADNLR